MTEILVLNPTAAHSADIADPGPNFGNIRGRTIGFRVDTLWRSWDWVVDVWAEKLRELGATTIFWRTHQGRTGNEGERIAAEEQRFMADSDLVVSGLGNCGSCTGWTIRDAMAATKNGKPAIAVVTATFEPLSESISKRAGNSGLRRFVLPHPLNEMSRETVEEIALKRCDAFLEAAGVERPAKLKMTA
jgi:hypothetical protein